MKTEEDLSNEATALNNENFGDDLDPLRCWDCNINFTNKQFLYQHLFHHIKQPQVNLIRIQLPPLKLTLKNKTGKSFEIVSSPNSSAHNSPVSQNSDSASNLAEIEEDKGESQGAYGVEDKNEEEQEYREEVELPDDDDATVNFSPIFAEVDGAQSPANSDSSNSGAKVNDGSECGSIPGAEPTPPPEPSPDYPKIRIKTTGLLQEPLTITEITDDNPEGETDNGQKDGTWNATVEDPLKLSGNEEILSIFNNNEKAKDFGFTTSDSEFMPLDRLDDRNRNALQLYNQNQVNQNALNSLAGLPMEALAQQVSRLHPSNNGMHQQNVLINIQQFPQAPPPPPPYQPPHMYHHPPQPMFHQPYQPYQPPNPMFYPPGAYPPHMPPPPQPQMPQLGQPPQMGQPPSTQPQNMQPNQPFRQLTPRQQPPVRHMRPQQMPGGLRQPQMVNQRQPIPRQRAPMVRPRGSAMTAVRSVRPRMPLNQNGQIRPLNKRLSTEQTLQAKKKRFDVLTPDKDDEDCQVICMQPKNMDGGLPQIQSVQGGTTEPSESSVMHLSDSITLSVRNPPPRPQSPKKSDAKAVANILATRGITVTATAKPKEKSDSQKNAAVLPAQLNLNAAVSIIPSGKNSNKSNSSGQESQLPTVDLTDDASPSVSQAKSAASAQKPNQRQGLPFKCDLCPAQYPNAMGLSKHRQSYHKTSSGMCEIGVPLINLKQPGIFQKLSSIGIYNYIPLPANTPDGMFALPIINSRSPGNVNVLGSTTMLTLGPVRTIPRPQNTPNGAQNARQQTNHQNK